ncbi:MAG: peroxiredoxin family protein, partial [Pyrinomonadaceae bacterium]|nr:peroxiredoxin family protein [Pyrinomonadaceae bacterium]
GKKWRLSDHLGDVTALLFYPKNETLVCTKQMCAVRNYWAEYLETKASIVGISSGTSAENLHFSKNHGLPLPILEDNDRKITRIYGSHWLMPIQFTRAIVVIDAKGFIRHRQIMLRAFRPTDKSIIASIYAARTDLIYENFAHLLKESKERNKRLL